MVAVTQMKSTQADPTAGIVQVGPKQAKAWLENNDVNRRPRPRLVEALSRDMLNGDWRLTGEAIKFSASGRLLDGQHRLMAVVKAGAMVPMFVVHGIEDEAQAHMDSGAKRSVSDVLHMQDGESDAAMLAAITRFAISWERNGTAPERGYATYTTQEIRDYISEHPQLRTATLVARQMASMVDCKPATVGFAFYWLSHIDQADANGFFEQWRSMTDLAADDPIRALIQKLALARRQHEYLKPRDELSLIFRAWNAKRKRRPLRLLKLRSQAGEVPIPNPV